jgi:hypothetical protein
MDKNNFILYYYIIIMEQFDKQVKEDQIEEINHYYEKESI